MYKDLYAADTKRRLFQPEVLMLRALHCETGFCEVQCCLCMMRVGYCSCFSLRATRVVAPPTVPQEHSVIHTLACPPHAAPQHTHVHPCASLSLPGLSPEHRFILCSFHTLQPQLCACFITALRPSTELFLSWAQAKLTVHQEPKASALEQGPKPLKA